MENIHVPNACNNRKKKHLHTQTSTENIVDIIICSALIYNKQQNGGKRFFFLPNFYHIMDQSEEKNKHT